MAYRKMTKRQAQRKAAIQERKEWVARMEGKPLSKFETLAMEQYKKEIAEFDLDTAANRS